MLRQTPQKLLASSASLTSNVDKQDLLDKTHVSFALGERQAVSYWDHCPERANGRANGPILRYFSFCRSP